MEPRQGSHRQPRASLPDAVTEDAWYLFKYTSRLRLTRQIRQLAFGASQSEARLVIRLPKGAKCSPDLKVFIEKHQGSVAVEEV